MKHAILSRIFPRRNSLLNSCLTLFGGSLLACGLHSGFGESPAPAAHSNSGLLHAAPLPLVASPQLTEPLGAAWKIHHGEWTPENGELEAAEIPQEKHSAVLHHRLGLKNAVVELEFRIEWKEDQVAARLDGQELRAQHDYFSTRKGLTWIGAGPAVATIRNLRIYGEENPAR